MIKNKLLATLRNSLVLGAALCASAGLNAQFKAAQPSDMMLGAAAPGGMAGHHYFAYVGTYTGPSSKGIYSYRFDTTTGKFSPLGLAATIEQPSFVVTDPRHRFLYAVTEIGSGGRGMGSVSSFAINAQTGALTFLNKVDSLGGGPCHMVVDKTGKTLFVANYGTGSVAAFALKADGSIGDKTSFVQLSGSSVNAHRQKGPHAHEVILSLDNRFLFVPDLGTDLVRIYKFDAAKGTITPNNPASASVRAGLGPRHFLFAPNGKFAYLVCEMGSSVVAFSYDPAKGALTSLQTISNIPEDFKGEDNSAEIGISRSGRFLYASNRGHDSITVFSIDAKKGTLTKIQNISSEGKIPRNFAIDPSGKYLIVANQNSNNMVVFDIDQKTGEIKPTNQVINVSSPVSIEFIPAP